MTPLERDARIARRQAIRAQIAARLQLEIARQHLKQEGVMNPNTLRRILKGQDYYISSLIDAAEGANLEIVILFKRRDAA